MKNEKCKKIIELKTDVNNLEKLSDTISTTEFKTNLKKIKQQLITVLLSKENCNESKIAIDEVFNLINNLQLQYN